MTGAVAKFSPDGRYFAVVTSRGILENNQIESTLSIFRGDEINTYISGRSSMKAPRAYATTKKTAVLSQEQSDAYGSVISELKWSANSRYLYFLGEGEHEERRLFRLSIGDGTTTVLTPAGYRVARFDISGSAVVCSLSHFVQEGGLQADVRAVTGESLKSILFPQSQPTPTERALWVVLERGGHSVARRVPTAPERDISWLPEVFALSPTGRMLIALWPLDKVPSDWSGFDPAPGYEWSRIQSGNPKLIAPNSVWRLKQYALINLDDGTRTALIDAPHDYALLYPYGSQAIWSSDERRVLLTNTFLPMTGIDGTERVKRSKPCAIAAVELPSRQAHCILSVFDASAGPSGGMVKGSLSFGGSNDQVVFHIRDAKGVEEARQYVFDGARWLQTKAGEDNEIHRNSLQITVHQELNDRPSLWATNTLTGQSRMIWDPNPQFDRLDFGQASVYHWKDPSGYEWSGGLVKPVGYVQGKRYPLVIQIYNFDKSRFLTDGLYPTAMAARHLASAGIMTLQVQRRFPHTFDLAEARAHLTGLESAINHLAEDGLVDPDKVGLIGFSSTCWYVEYALITDPKLFKAATIADGADFSYMQYRLFGVSSEAVEREYEAMNGSKPIGESGLKRWVESAPGFRLDQVVAPVRIEAIAPISILSEWEIYSSLEMQGKPVDLIYFPSGQHILQKPLDRFASQEGNVDWYRFWLQGYEDPDATKREQYKRWKKMKQSSLDG